MARSIFGRFVIPRGYFQNKTAREPGSPDHKIQRTDLGGTGRNVSSGVELGLPNWTLVLDFYLLRRYIGGSAGFSGTAFLRRGDTSSPHRRNAIAMCAYLTKVSSVFSAIFFVDFSLVVRPRPQHAVVDCPAYPYSRHEYPRHMPL